MSDLLDPKNSPQSAEPTGSSQNQRPMIAALSVAALILGSSIYFIIPRESVNAESDSPPVYIASAKPPEMNFDTLGEIAKELSWAGPEDNHEDNLAAKSQNSKEVKSQRRNSRRIYEHSENVSMPDPVRDYRNKLFENSLARLNQKSSSSQVTEQRVENHEPLGDHSLMAGGVIPAVLQTGINSDLKGLIIGRVTRDIFDSATGEYLLIPAGSKIVGNYDEAVAVGQERVLLSWKRIIFPDSSSVDLGTMGGHDVSGYSGLSDEVDNHYGKIFGAGILLSLVGAGYQLSQPASTGELSAQEILSSEIGKNFHETSSQMIARQMQIKPTIRIRQGMKFLILVNKDLNLNEWSW